jgi:integrase
MPAYRENERGTKWRVKVWFKGKPHSKIVDGNKADAEAYEARWRLHLEEADPTLDVLDVPTFSSFCVRRYRTHAEGHLKASSWRNRQYTLATLEEHFGRLRLSEVNVAAVEAYKTERRRTGIRPSTVNDELKVLFAVLNYARDLGYQLPRLRVKRLREGKRRVTAWSHQDVAALYDSVTKLAPDLLPVVVFLLNTGCRKGEALALEWRTVDLERRVVRIEPSDEWQPKDDEPREVPISDALLPWLDGARRSARWVFPSSTGERYAFWPQRAFDRARSSATVPSSGAPKCIVEGCQARRAHRHLAGGPHTTRHTYATHFLERERDIYLLAKVLGHSTARVTELYGHLLPDSMARAARAVALAPGVTPAAWTAAQRWGIGAADIGDRRSRKLSAADVRAILLRLATGRRGVKSALAREYGVSETAIRKVAAGTARTSAATDGEDDGAAQTVRRTVPKFYGSRHR